VYGQLSTIYNNINYSILAARDQLHYEQGATETVLLTANCNWQSKPADRCFRQFNHDCL